MSTVKDLLRLNYFYDLRLSRIRFDVQDVNTRRNEGREPPGTAARCVDVAIRAERRTASVPTKVVELVARL